MTNLNANPPIPNERKPKIIDQALQRGRQTQAGSSDGGRPAAKYNPPVDVDLSVEHVAVLGYD